MTAPKTHRSHRRPRAPGALAGFALALATAGPAHAYVRTRTEKGNLPMQWDHTCLPIEVLTATPPQYLAAGDTLRIATISAATWSRARVDCSALDLHVSARDEAEAEVSPDDGPNQILFRRTEWSCPDPSAAQCHDPRALAITSVFARVRDGLIQHSVVEVNAVSFRWGDVTAGTLPPSTHDLQNALTHELGHFIGLDHTCWDGSTLRANDQNGVPIAACSDASRAIRDTVMFPSAIPGDTKKRTLSPDDRQAVCDIYPVPAGQVATDGGIVGACAAAAITAAEPTSSGCALGGRGARSAAAWGIAVSLLGLGAARRRRRA